MLRETWTILPSHEDLRFMGGADASRDIDGFGGLRTIRSSTSSLGLKGGSESGTLSAGSLEAKVAG